MEDIIARFWGPASGRLHNQTEQRFRQARAIGVPIIPQHVDRDSGHARIHDYAVCLWECTCPDFGERQVPCKHMYRLAHELGVFDLGHECITYHNKPVPDAAPSQVAAWQHAAQRTPRALHQPREKSPITQHRHTTAALAICLGTFGAHKFYLNKNWMGAVYAVFFWTAIPTLVSIVEGLIYLSTSDARWQHAYLT